MNPDIKARWIAALHDPNAKQTHGWLGRSNGSRCCLGVLCDLAVADGVIGTPELVSEDPGISYLAYSDVPGEFADYISDLPNAVQIWTGLPDGDPSAGNHRLSWWNDVERKTFPEIADLIEQYL